MILICIFGPVDSRGVRILSFDQAGTTGRAFDNRYVNTIIEFFTLN